jgi:hypothetical protein
MRNLVASRGDLTADKTNLFLQDQSSRLRRIVQEPKQSRGADRWMAGERQLRCRREDAQARGVRRIGCGKDKDCFRQAKLARDGLHALRIEAFAILNDRERVAGEALTGEDIEGGETPLPQVVRQ